MAMAPLHLPLLSLVLPCFPFLEREDEKEGELNLL